MMSKLRRRENCRRNYAPSIYVCFALLKRIIKINETTLFHFISPRNNKTFCFFEGAKRRNKHICHFDQSSVQLTRKAMNFHFVLKNLSRILKNIYFCCKCQRISKSRRKKEIILLLRFNLL